MEQETTNQTTVTVTVDSVTEQKSKFQTATDAGKKGLEVTGRFMTKVLDLADSIDRRLYGIRLKLFIGLSLAVVVLAPLIDWATNNWRDRWTAWSTAFLFVFLLIMTFAWIGSLRDDEGKWSFKRVRKRIWTYIQINIDFFKDSFSLPTEEKLYRLSTSFIIGTFCWKALQNVSVFIRKPIEGLFHTRLGALRSFEKFTNQWTLWLFIAGAAVLIYAISKHKDKVLEFLRRDFFPFLKPKQPTQIQPSQLQLSSTTDLVLNTKDKNQIEGILNSKNPELFNQFISSLQKWTPRDCQDEDDFQNSFHRQLKRNIPHATVAREFRIMTDETDRRKDRKADIVIDETILVEMKSSFRTTETDRATSQVWNYAELWGNKGPVILLLCNADYEEAKNTFNSRLTTLARQDKKVIAFVRPK